MAANPLTIKAQLAERANRYEDMCGYTKKMAESSELDEDQRSLLSVAYKNLISQKRSAWRILDDIRRKEKARGMDGGVEIVEEMMKGVEEEIVQKCQELLHLIDHHCMKHASESGQVFFMKLRGDYWRYIAELPTEHKRTAIEKAEEAYTEARNAARKLPADDPIRPSLELNYAIFLYEVLDKPAEARRTAEDALNDCKSRRGGEYLDSTIIMQLLQKNISLWEANLS